MTSSRLRALALFATLSLAAASPTSIAFAQQPSAADLETARDLNRQGKELRAAGHILEALEKFKAAHDLGRTPVTGIELARTHAMLSQLVEAREVCLGIARMPVASDETERSVTARAEAAKLADELRPRIPSVLVRVTGVPAGKTPTITIDKRPVPVAAIGQAQKVNPGSHEIVARVENGPETHVSIDLKEGETRDVPLTVQAPPDAGAVGAGVGGALGSTAVPPSSTKQKVTMIGFTVAGVGVVIGAMSGLLASSKKSNLESLCVPDKKCGPNAYDDLDAARTWSTVSTVAFALGGVGLALGFYGLFSKEDPKPPPTGARVTPFIGPGSVGVHGAF